MTGLEYQINGTIIVNASDPAVGGKARYMIAKVIDGEVWYHASYDNLDDAKAVIAETGTIPMFIIDKEVS